MADPLLCDVPLPLHRRLYPLGFPLDLFTNSDSVLAAAEESWGAFTQRFEVPAVTIRLGVTESSGSSVAGEPLFRGHRNLLSITLSSADFAVCDLRQSFAYAWVSETVTNNRPFFRFFFLEAIGYVLLSAKHLAAVHAACLEHRGKGILFCGDSGAGKSTLAYACARAGWKYICDDASYLVRSHASPLACGNPFVLRLRDTAADLFPEIAQLPIVLRPNGKPTIEIFTSAFSDMEVKCQTAINRVLFLNRSDRSVKPVLRPFSKEEAIRQWSEMICYGDEECRRGHQKSLENLLKADLYAFEYSELSSAVAYLEKQ